MLHQEIKYIGASRLLIGRIMVMKRELFEITDKTVKNTESYALAA
jgi:hypothetical protein